MTGPAKRKGDDFEREAVQLLASLGITAHRLFGAGQDTDVGDLLTTNGAVIFQCKAWRDSERACFDAAAGAARQAVAHPTAAVGVGLVRRRGGRVVATIEPETLAWLLEAAGVVPAASSPTSPTI
jgi:hypothetical protein